MLEIMLAVLTICFSVKAMLKTFIRKDGFQDFVLAGICLIVLLQIKK